MRVVGQHHTPAALPPGKTQYPSCRRLGGSEWGHKISPPLGFDPRTSSLQRVAILSVTSVCTVTYFTYSHFGPNFRTSKCTRASSDPPSSQRIMGDGDSREDSLIEVTEHSLFYCSRKKLVFHQGTHITSSLP